MFEIKVSSTLQVSFSDILWFLHRPTYSTVEFQLSSGVVHTADWSSFQLAFNQFEDQFVFCQAGNYRFNVLLCSIVGARFPFGGGDWLALRLIFPKTPMARILFFNDDAVAVLKAASLHLIEVIPADLS